MEDILTKAVRSMEDQGAEFCDARHQMIDRTFIVMVDGGVRTIDNGKLEGVSIRSRINGSWGYASTVDLGNESIMDASARAVVNAKHGTAKGKRIPERKANKAKISALVKIHPSKVPIEEKVAAIKDLDRAQKIDDRVVNVNSVYREEVKNNLLISSFGDSLQWEEVRARLFAQPVAHEGDRTEYYFDLIDGTKGFEMVKEADIMAFGKHAAEEAVKMLKAKKSPSGLQTVISDPMISGLLAHEVMGHASEADEVVKKRSFLSSVVGKKVASPLITMVDDGTVPGAHGSIPFDDEGTPSSRTTIIKDGVYQGYMHSLETAAEMGTRPTGNGRAQDFGHRVWVRMTNTFFDHGDATLEEMLEGVKLGVLTDHMISGMEDPVAGGFEAKALRGFLIENGEVTDMLRSFTLTGSALEILKTTDAVGKEVLFDGGTCGKGIEDFVPVSSGGPYCRSKITLGGG
jgi:TldD protein